MMLLVVRDESFVNCHGIIFFSPSYSSRTHALLEKTNEVATLNNAPGTRMEMVGEICERARFLGFIAFGWRYRVGASVSRTPSKHPFEGERY